MTVGPSVPLGGYAGWRFLSRTYDRQLTQFTESPQLQRDVAHFRDQIGSVSDAKALVNDRQLLRVALGAFGLGDDLKSKAFIEKTLEQGARDPLSLANRLSDDRYRLLADAFSFDRVLPGPTQPEFAEDTIDRFLRQEFEAAVGEIDQGLRQALYLQRRLPELVSAAPNSETFWFQVMGDPALRDTVDKAFGLPENFAQVDLDRQLATFQDRLKSQLGLSSYQDLASAEAGEELIQRFLFRNQIESISVASSASVALALLQT